ncbi:MAG: hypothetical protein Q8N96_11415 [Methylovulum sp.]|nr:hypothetical protein [Methylovulum sp.]
MQITEKEFPYILGLLTIAVVYSIKIVGESCYIVFFYWVIFTLFIFFEIKQIRENIRQNYINIIFKKESAIYKWLSSNNKLVLIISLAVSLPISTSLLIFVFLSDTFTVILMFLDALIFCFLYHKVKFDSGELLNTTLVENTRLLFETWILVTLNSSLMVVLYYSVSFFTTEVFPALSDEIPKYINDHVNHHCYPLHIIGRVVADVDLEIRSLMSIKQPAVKYLTGFTYLATMSGVPFIAFSFILKLALDMNEKFKIYKKIKRN